jgi:hypothetical protein
MDIRYNLYYATSANGPWTLANDTPLDHVSSGNEYTISGLGYRTSYYFQIIGGIIEDNEFVPLAHQHIGPQLDKAGGVELTTAPAYQAQTFTPAVVATAFGLSHEVTVV